MNESPLHSHLHQQQEHNKNNNNNINNDINKTSHPFLLLLCLKNNDETDLFCLHQT